MPTIDLALSGGVPSEPYAVTQDVTNALGTIGTRLPSWVSLPDFLGVAHSEVVDRLARVYPDAIPTFDGNGLTVVRYAEAKLAAAAILEAIRVNLPDLGDAPDRLRASAYASLDDGVVGYPAGSVDVDTDGDPATPPRPVNNGPRVSSFTSLSMFPDPYAAARDASLSGQ